MTLPRIVLSRRLPQQVERALAERFDVRLNETDEALDESVLADAMRTADALVCTVADRVPAAVIGASPRRARILANFGVGVDHIDIAAAREAGITVTNTPGVLTDDTADLAIALMLAVARRLGEGERELRTGRWTGWRPTHMLGTSVSGATLGVIGMGRIGRAVARRASHGFGMRVLYYNPSVVLPTEAALAGAERRNSVEGVLAEADIVTLHLPAKPETRHMIDAARLRLMRRSAFLINTARGDVVDEDALADALHEGVIAGAGLDVYEHEPRVHPRLLTLENVVLAPHLGSATLETRIAMGERVIANLEAFFAGREPPDRVG